MAVLADVRIPALHVHQASGRARVKIDGRHIYCGAAGSMAAIGRYEEVVREWLRRTHGIEAPTWQPQSAPASPAALRILERHEVRRRRPATVADLCDLYTREARGIYTKWGRQTHTALVVARAASLLKLSQYAVFDPDDYEPRHLKHFQQWLACDPDRRWSRKTINDYVRYITLMFKWAVSESFVAVEVYQAMLTVSPLRRGRSPAPGVAPPREREARRLPTHDEIRKILQHLTPPVRAMVELQLSTAMRPCEILKLRHCDVAPFTSEGDVWKYTVAPDANKVDHEEIERVVYIGPRGAKAIAPWHRSDGGEAYVFSPREAELARNAKRREGRKSVRWESHSAEARRLRRAQEPATWGDHYTPSGYRCAIRRACAIAGVPKWTPNQLRHLQATRITTQGSLFDASAQLGHQDVRTTMRYIHAQKLVARAIRIARKHG